MKSAVILNVVMTSVVAPLVEWNLHRKETKGRLKDKEVLDCFTIKFKETCSCSTKLLRRFKVLTRLAILDTISGQGKVNRCRNREGEREKKRRETERGEGKKSVRRKRDMEER